MLKNGRGQTRTSPAGDRPTNGLTVSVDRDYSGLTAILRWTSTTPTKELVILMRTTGKAMYEVIPESHIPP